MLTDKQKIDFGKHKAGYTFTKAKKPNNGNLYVDGVKFLNNLPFPILQKERSRLLQKGYAKSRIKITY